MKYPRGYFRRQRKMSIRITIGQKFSFAFLIILLLMALTFGIVIKSYNSVITNLETTNEDASKQGAAGNVRFSIAQLIIFANDYIITEKDYYRQMFEQQRMRVADYQKKLRMFYFSSREFAIVDSIAVDVDSINAYAHRIFAISKPRLSSEAVTLMEIMHYKFGDAVNRKTTEIFDIIFGRIEELRIQSAHSKEQMLNTIYTVFSLALLVSLVFVFLSVQRIVKPIKTIVKAADEIAKGDYTQRPVVKTHDEVALLARSFYRMIEAVEKSHLELDSSMCFTENIYATVPSGLLVFGKEAKVLSANKSFCELFDLKQQQIVGQSIDDVLQLIGISQKCKDAVAAREPFRNLECVSPDNAKEKMTLNLTLSEIHNAAEEVLLVIEDITERRIAEETIKKSEVLFRTTLYSIGDAVITTNEHGIVQRLNPVAEHLTGWKEFDAQGKSIEEVFNIINEEIRNKVENPVQKVLREGIIVGLANHTLLISKDGIEAPIADSGAPIKNETGDIVGVVLVFRDQTEEREKQKALEHSNARLKEAQRMAHVGNWELDIQKNKLYWCDEIFRMFEIDQTEFETSYEAFLNTVHPDDREFVNNAYTESVKNKTPYNIDHRLLMKDGRIKYVHEQCETYYNDQGHPIRSAGTVQDITERKRVEEALRAAEAKYRMLVEQVPTIIYTTSVGETTATLYISPQSEAVLGYSPNEWLADPEFWLKHLHPDDRESVAARYAHAALMGELFCSEYRMLTRDGRVVWLHDEATIVRSGESQYLQGIALDITERKRAEEALLISERKYKDIFNFAPLGIYQSSLDGKFITVNKALIKILGYNSSDEMTSLDMDADVYYEKGERAKLIARFEPQGSAADIELRWKKKDGVPIWIQLNSHAVKDAEGKTLYFEGFVRDITERKFAEETRKHAEAELAEREKRYRALFNLSPSGIVLEDIEGNIFEVNEAYCNSIGYSKEELIGRNVRMVASPEQIPHIEDHIALLRSGKTLQHVIENIKKDGTRCWVELHETLISLPGGREGFLVVANDISERRHAEEELLKIGTAIEQTADCVVITDKNGIIQYANRAFIKIFGYSKEEVLGKTPRIIKSELHPPEFYEELWKTILSGKIFSETFINKRKDGELVYEIKTITPIKDKEGNITHFVSTAKEITEQYHAKMALQKSEERYHELIEHASDGIFIVDASDKYIEVNSSGCIMLGYTRDEILQKTIQDLVRMPLDKPLQLEELRQGKTLLSERELIRKDGSPVPVEISAKLLPDGNLLAIVRNITERKKLEKELKEYRDHLENMVEERTIELRQSEERFRALAEGSEDIIMRFNSSHQHVYVNPVVKKITGLKADDYIGKTYQQLGFPDELVKLWDETLKKTFLTKKMNRTEFELPNGIWIDWIIIPEFDELGNVNTVVTSGRDITGLKEYEKKINEALQKEKELNQLKSTFISTASHQFRTPLASILSSAQMIKRYANKWSEEKLNEHHKRINESIKNLTQMMDDVLLISKSEKGKDSLKPEEADVEELFNKFIEEVKPLLNEKQKINYKNRVGKKYIKLDKKALHQIVNNLLSNAVKYSPEGGTIKIETGFKDGKLKIIVEDKGVGIPKEEIKYIFNSFYRTTNAVNFPGTGLGLNIVKRMVDLYKGIIDVASVLDKGTKFTVKLPVSALNEYRVITAKKKGSS